jgi:hypothetical protein
MDKQSFFYGQSFTTQDHFMFVQMMWVRVPTGSMKSFKESINQVYLKTVAGEIGLVQSYFLEQVDDSDIAQLIMVWQSQSDLDTFITSGLTEQYFEDLQDFFPGLMRRSHSYVISAKESYT